MNKGFAVYETRFGFIRVEYEDNKIIFPKYLQFKQISKFYIRIFNLFTQNLYYCFSHF